jgi:hypothetical protein
VRDFYLPQAYTNSTAFQLPEHCRKLPMQDKAPTHFSPAELPIPFSAGPAAFNSTRQCKSSSSTRFPSQNQLNTVMLKAPRHINLVAHTLLFLAAAVVTRHNSRGGTPFEKEFRRR